MENTISHKTLTINLIKNRNCYFCIFREVGVIFVQYLQLSIARIRTQVPRQLGRLGVYRRYTQQPLSCEYSREQKPDRVLQRRGDQPDDRPVRQHASREEDHHDL